MPDPEQTSENKEDITGQGQRASDQTEQTKKEFDENKDTSGIPQPAGSGDDSPKPELTP